MPCYSRHIQSINYKNGECLILWMVAGGEESWDSKT